jgi:hypothetical protein
MLNSMTIRVNAFSSVLRYGLRHYANPNPQKISLARDGKCYASARHAPKQGTLVATLASARILLYVLSGDPVVGVRFDLAIPAEDEGE